jgi:hypothetical protein
MEMDEPAPTIPVGPLRPVGYTIKETAQLEKCSVAEIYIRINEREYDEVLKDGKKTLIPPGAIERRRARKLKPAQFPGVRVAPRRHRQSRSA